MKQNILTILVALLLINALWNLFKPTTAPNYDYERERYQELKQDIKTVYKDVTTNKAAIINFKHKLDEVDTVYNDIDKVGMRERSTDIFRRYNMLRLR